MAVGATAASATAGDLLVCDPVGPQEVVASVVSATEAAGDGESDERGSAAALVLPARISPLGLLALISMSF